MSITPSQVTNEMQTVNWTAVESNASAITDLRANGAAGAAVPNPNEAVHRGSRTEEARLLVDMATEFRESGWPDKSRRFARRALSIFEQERETDPRDVVRALLCLAGSRADLGDHIRAAADYRRASDVLDRLANSADQLEVQNLRIQTVRGLASVTLAQGEDRQAEIMLRDVLTSAHQTFGSNHAQIAAILNDLGLVYRQAGLLDGASRLHQLALSITENALGPTHRQAATILQQLGILEHARGRFADGEPFARRAAAIWQKNLGADHPKVAVALLSLARLLEGQGKDFEAKQTHRHARKILERWFGRGYEVADTGPSPAARANTGHHGNTLKSARVG